MIFYIIDIFKTGTFVEINLIFENLKDRTGWRHPVKKLNLQLKLNQNET